VVHLRPSLARPASDPIKVHDLSGRRRISSGKDGIGTVPLLAKMGYEQKLKMTREEGVDD
jgi:hypothetical protein